jgi:hypothetical protein
MQLFFETNFTIVFCYKNAASVFSVQKAIVASYCCAYNPCLLCITFTRYACFPFDALNYIPVERQAGYRFNAVISKIRT